MLGKPLFWSMLTTNAAVLIWNEHLEEQYGEGLPELRWEATMVRAHADSKGDASHDWACLPGHV